jgi:hypothetical protein
MFASLLAITILGFKISGTQAVIAGIVVLVIVVVGGWLVLSRRR